MKNRSRGCALAAIVLVAPVLLVATTASASTPSTRVINPASSPAPSVNGYWEVGSDGGIFSFNAPFQESMGGSHIEKPIVGIAADPAPGGYWEVASDGGVFSFNAPFWGSMANSHLDAPVVGIAADPATGGYWEVAADGGVFSFDAPFDGSMGGKPLDQPVVGIAANPVGGGYWEVASDGGIFSFGAAAFYGSEGTKPLDQPIVGMTTDPATGGYLELGSDGGLFSFNAPYEGSMGNNAMSDPVVGIAGAISSPIAPAASISSASSGSNSYAGTASATNDNATATATGGGALTVSQFGSNPAGAPSFSSAGEYFNVALSSGNSFTATTIDDCNLNGGNSLRWWNPAASSGAGAWQAVSPAPTHTAGSPPCASLTLGPTSSPTLSQLSDTVFGVSAISLIQGAPSTAIVVDHAGYSGQLTTTNGSGTVTYTEMTSAGSTDVAVDANGAINAATTLAPGTYTVSGTDRDTSGTGNWSFALTVGGTINQVAPTSGTVTTTASAAYAGQLETTGNSGAVTFVTTVTSPSVTVSGSGAVTTTSALAANTYTVSGTDLDAFGDTGTWSFLLTVTAVTLNQSSFTSNTFPAGTAWGNFLAVTNGTGTVSWTETSSADSSIVVVTSNGFISCNNQHPSGVYTVSGTDSDSEGDTGTWSFTYTET